MKKRKIKRIVLMLSSYVLIAALAIGGTIAYLTSTDDEVNVMALGNVKIEQIELQRIDKEGNGSDNLEEFDQNKPLLPGYEDSAWERYDWEDAVHTRTAWNDLFNSETPGVQDKFVFVQNTGKNDAYFRTVFAFENDPSGQLIHVNWAGNDVWDYSSADGVQSPNDIEWIEDVNIGGVLYDICVATYQDALLPGEKSHPSLLQIGMDKFATNEDMMLWGDTYEVLVFTQAIQVDGFDTADEALNAGFEKITAENHPWINGFKVPVVASTAADLIAALENNDTVVLANDITVTDQIDITKPTSLDLNGKTLTVSRMEAMADTTLSNGTVVHGESTYPALSVSEGTLTLNNVEVVCETPCSVNTNASSGNQSAEYVGISVWSGKAVLNNSTIKVKNDTTRWGNTAVGVGMYGGEFTMNGGSIVVETVPGTRRTWEAAFFASTNADKTVNLNNVTIDADTMLEAWGGKTTVNTTDAKDSWDGKCNTNGGTYEINYK